jgi:hypothetical protein
LLPTNKSASRAVKDSNGTANGGAKCNEASLIAIAATADYAPSATEKIKKLILCIPRYTYFVRAGFSFFLFLQVKNYRRKF